MKSPKIVIRYAISHKDVIGVRKFTFNPEHNHYVSMEDAEIAIELYKPQLLGRTLTQEQIESLEPVRIECYENGYCIRMLLSDKQEKEVMDALRKYAHENTKKYGEYRND